MRFYLVKTSKTNSIEIHSNSCESLLAFKPGRHSVPKCVVAREDAVLRCGYRCPATANSRSSRACADAQVDLSPHNGSSRLPGGSSSFFRISFDGISRGESEFKPIIRAGSVHSRARAKRIRLRILPARNTVKKSSPSRKRTPRLFQIDNAALINALRYAI